MTINATKTIKIMVSIMMLVRKTLMIAVASATKEPVQLREAENVMPRMTIIVMTCIRVMSVAFLCLTLLLNRKSKGICKSEVLNARASSGLASLYQQPPANRFDAFGQSGDRNPRFLRLRLLQVGVPFLSRARRRRARPGLRILG